MATRRSVKRSHFRNVCNFDQLFALDRRTFSHHDPALDRHYRGFADRGLHEAIGAAVIETQVHCSWARLG